MTPALNVQGWTRLGQGTGAAASPAWAIQDISSPAAHCWSPTTGLWMYWPAAAPAAHIPQPGTAEHVQQVQSGAYIWALQWTKTHMPIVNVVPLQPMSRHSSPPDPTYYKPYRLTLKCKVRAYTFPETKEDTEKLNIQLSNTEELRNVKPCLMGIYNCLTPVTKVLSYQENRRKNNISGNTFRLEIHKSYS